MNSTSTEQQHSLNNFSPPLLKRHFSVESNSQSQSISPDDYQVVPEKFRKVEEPEEFIDPNTFNEEEEEQEKEDAEVQGTKFPEWRKNAEVQDAKLAELIKNAESQSSTTVELKEEVEQVLAIKRMRLSSGGKIVVSCSKMTKSAAYYSNYFKAVLDKENGTQSESQNSQDDFQVVPQKIRKLERADDPKIELGKATKERKKEENRNSTTVDAQMKLAMKRKRNSCDAMTDGKLTAKKTRVGWDWK